MDDWVQVTCEHWKISRQALFLWQSFANGLSPQCSCVRSPSPCNRQQRNLLTSNTHHEKYVLSGNKYYLANLAKDGQFFIFGARQIKYGMHLENITN